jgi:hypothetical protein
MFLTGNRDVDINIISFCDNFTIVKLLDIDRKLIEAAKNEIIEVNKDNKWELAGLITLLMDKNEKELARHFLVFCETKIENAIDDWEYREILFHGWRPDVVELYLSIENFEYLKMYEYFIKDNERLEKDEFYNLFVGFYHAAINSKNLLILESLIKLWDNQCFVYNLNDDEYCPDELCELVSEINTLDAKARELCNNS